MLRRIEAEQLLRNGHSPAEIAKRMSISVGTVIQYLRTRVGEGCLRLSDLYFSWSPEKRTILKEALDRFLSSHWLTREDYRRLSSNGLTREEFELFQSLRTGHVFRGDMYDYVSVTEVSIHGFVLKILQQSFGHEKAGWWRKGVPSSIRVKCVTRQEEDDEPSESPYAYTNLIDLSAVILKHWKHFETHLPENYHGNRRQLEHDLERLNSIRNAVMHPVKGRKWTEDDFVFARRLSSRFDSAL